MRPLQQGLCILAVFILGCAAATVGRDFVTPPLNAEISEKAKIEYQCVFVANTNDRGSYQTDSANSVLNKMAAKGWRLITMTDDRLGCFARDR